jgi:hypothetical protein
MPIQHQVIIGGATGSEPENVSEIQVLASRVQVLTGSFDRWNNGMIWALVVAAVAALAVVISTRIVVLKAKQLTEAQA